jgi:hypothetical protein
MLLGVDAVAQLPVQPVEVVIAEPRSIEAKGDYRKLWLGDDLYAFECCSGEISEKSTRSGASWRSGM